MKQTFRLDGLCCANCAAKIERQVQKLPGVSKAAVNFMLQKLVLYQEGSNSAAAEVQKIVRRIEPRVTVQQEL